MTILLTLFFQGGSPGLVVMGRDLHSKGCGSNPSTVYWMDIFSHLFVLKICNVCLKRPKINEKGRDWPIFKKSFVFPEISPGALWWCDPCSPCRHAVHWCLHAHQQCHWQWRRSGKLNTIWLVLKPFSLQHASRT